MYKEYRDVSRTLAVQSLYSDMAARHRARFRSIHVPSPQPFPSANTCRMDIGSN
jgi:ribosomal protein L20A (L18A)